MGVLSEGLGRYAIGSYHLAKMARDLFMMFSPLKVIGILLSILAVSHCLYEDQVGKFDW